MHKFNILNAIKIITVISVLISCALSPEEKELKYIYKEINKTSNQIENILRSANINSELKEQKIMALILNSTHLVDEWPNTYLVALSSVPIERLQNHQYKFDAATNRLTKLIQSITK